MEGRLWPDALRTSQKLMQYSDINLLIIDDLSDNRLLLRADLEDELPGIRIDEASGGDEGLALIAANSYTIVICDVLMPKTDGFTVLSAAREIPSAAGVPFLFLSALKQPEIVKRGLELGAVDFLVKPYDLDELVSKVRTLAGMRRLQVELERSQHQLIEANEHLQKLNEEKNHILQIVSHDLRSPLSGIRGLARILQSEEEGNDPAVVREFAAMIADTADSLTRLVSDLMNVARIEAGMQIQLDLSECDISAVVEQAVESHRKAAEKKHIALKYENLSRNTVLMADEQKMHQVMGNLLSNAVKFTRQRGSICVKICDEGAGCNRLMLSVADTGVGIPQEQIPNLFEGFGSGSRRGTDNERGVGLGLPIVHSFVVLHGGEMRLITEEGKGTTFEVFLPRNGKTAHA